MKKWTSLFLALAMALSLAACGSSNQGNTPEPPASVSGSTAEETPTEEPAEEPSEEPAESETPTAGDSSSVLIAYFSWSGNTEQVAQIIQQETGGDLFEITPATPYTDDYNELLDIAQQEQSDNARPELAGQVENWEQYDTIFVGYPNWWSDAPMAVYTFLESYDWDGKTLIPFNTSASGGFGRSLSGLEESASGVTILDGLSLTNLTINNKARTIEMTKKFEKAASRFDSDEYKALQEASKNYPAYKVVVKTGTAKGKYSSGKGGKSYVYCLMPEDFRTPVSEIPGAPQPARHRSVPAPPASAVR